MVSGLQLGVADSSSMPSLPVMKSALLQQNEASGGPSRGNRESAVHILEDTLDDEDLYEAIQRPEVDVSQTKPHGESRYTGRVLRTPDINKPTRNIVESIWMGLVRRQTSICSTSSADFIALVGGFHSESACARPISSDPKLRQVQTHNHD